jgi:hypothetical protein
MLTLKNLRCFEDAHAFIEYAHIYSKMLKNMYKGTFMNTFGSIAAMLRRGSVVRRPPIAPPA